VRGRELQQAPDDASVGLADTHSTVPPGSSRISARPGGGLPIVPRSAKQVPPPSDGDRLRCSYLISRASRALARGSSAAWPAREECHCPRLYEESPGAFGLAGRRRPRGDRPSDGTKTSALYTRAQGVLRAPLRAWVRGTVATKGSANTSNSRLSGDFQLLLGGSSFSMLGSRITAVAYPLLVLAVTGSPMAAGLSTFAVIAPSALIYLPAGVLVDRWDPRRVMFASELGRFLAVAVIVGAIVLRKPSLPILILAAATEQTLEVFSALAERRLSLSLVGRNRATSALVRGETRTHLVVMLGRPMGAFLFGAGPVIPFAADAFTFVVSVSALFRIKNGRPKERMTLRHMAGEFCNVVGQLAQLLSRFAQLHTHAGKQQEHIATSHMMAEIREVGDWLRSHLFALVGLCLTAGTTLVGQALIMVFFAEAHSQHLLPMKIGIVLAASGAGGVIGSALASKLFKLVDYRLLQGQMGVWFITLGCLAFFGSWSYLGIAAAMASLGFAGALGNIAIETFLALHAGPMLARVVSVDRLTSFCALAAGPALGGMLYANFGVQSAVAILFAMTLVLVTATLAATAIRYIRHRRAHTRRSPSLGALNQSLWLDNDTSRPDLCNRGFDRKQLWRSAAWKLFRSSGSVLWYFTSRAIRAVTWGPAYLLSPQEVKEVRQGPPELSGASAPELLESRPMELR